MTIRGELNPRQAAAIKGLLAEWRQSFKDSGVLAQFHELQQVVARLSAAKGGTP